MLGVTDAQYTAMCRVIDRAKMDDRSLDTDEYAGMILDVLSDDYVERRIAKLTEAWEDATGDTASDYLLSEDDWKAGLSDDEAAEIVGLIEAEVRA